MTNTESIACYACVGKLPHRDCYPIYDPAKCGEGTYPDYNSCGLTCGGPNNNGSNYLFYKMEKLYEKYVSYMPYKVPRNFTLVVFASIVVVFIILNIAVSIVGSKIIKKCFNKNMVLSLFAIIFLVLSWIGHVLPYYGNFTSIGSLVLTCICLAISGSNCK